LFETMGPLLSSTMVKLKKYPNKNAGGKSCS